MYDPPATKEVCTKNQKTASATTSASEPENSACLRMKDGELFQVVNLEGQGVTGRANNGSLDLAASNKAVRVSQLAASQRTLKSLVGRRTEVVVVGNSISSVGAVQSLLGVGPGVRFNKNLSTFTSVDTIGDVVVVRVVDVSSTETNGRTTGVDVLPEVVGIGDVEETLVLCTVAVGVSDEGCLPVVVDEGVGDGDPVSSVSDVQESVIVVLVVVEVGREINVINPDVGGFF